MAEIILTILLVGFCAGFLFSMPVAGPISILITSNALQGHYRYCVRAAVGAAVGEILYIFIAVYGVTILYSLYRPCLPYFLLVGAIFLIGIGFKIANTHLDLERLDLSGIVSDKLKNKGGLRTGFLLVITNLSLVVGWLTSSFLVFSFVSAIGLNTGGLDILICHNVNTMGQIAGKELTYAEPLKQSLLPAGNMAVSNASSMTKMLLSGIYSVAVSLGIFVWFFNFTRFLIKKRQRLKVNILSRTIQFLGVILCLIGIYLTVQAIMILI